jgi:GxxExxY protein
MDAASSQTKFAREPNGSQTKFAREPNGSQTKFAREPNGSQTTEAQSSPMAVDIIVQMILENIIEAGNKILNTLGSGHTESVYHKAFEVEFRKQGIEYASEVVAPIYYRGMYVGHGRADIVIPGILVMELKATSSPPRDLERSRIKTYMESLGISDGIIINFSQKQKKCMVMII